MDDQPGVSEWVVYYVGVGDRIKIGRTKRHNLTTRLSGLHAEVLFAIEPGGSETELRRHEQFAHRRLDGEWFSPGSDLLDHIQSLEGLETLPPLPRRCRDGRGNPYGRSRRRPVRTAVVEPLIRPPGYGDAR